MALINCPNPNCGKENISDSGTCPNCGCSPKDYLLETKKIGICPECKGKTNVEFWCCRGNKYDHANKETDAFEHWGFDCPNCGWKGYINETITPYMVSISQVDELIRNHKKRVAGDLEKWRTMYIPGYKQQKDEEKYNSLVPKMNRASTENDFSALMQDFKALGGYKDAAKFAKECEEKFNELKKLREEKELREKEEKYSSLVLDMEKAMQSPDGESKERALYAIVDALEKLGNYKDASSRARNCWEKIRDLVDIREAEEERARQYNIYVKDMEKKMETSDDEWKEERLKELANNFRELGGYRDSAKLAKQCETERENSMYRREEEQKKRTTTAMLLCFFGGMFGAHRFYAGKKGSAVVYLILTIISALLYFPIIGVGIAVIVDMVKIAHGNFEDEYRYSFKASAGWKTFCYIWLGVIIIAAIIIIGQLLNM